MSFQSPIGKNKNKYTINMDKNQPLLNNSNPEAGQDQKCCTPVREVIEAFLTLVIGMIIGIGCAFFVMWIYPDIAMIFNEQET